MLLFDRNETQLLNELTILELLMGKWILNWIKERIENLKVSKKELCFILFFTM